MKDCERQFRPFTIFKALDMLIKRFTLMGAILVSAGWVTRTQADEFDGGKKMVPQSAVSHITHAAAADSVEGIHAGPF